MAFQIAQSTRKIFTIVPETNGVIDVEELTTIIEEAKRSYHRDSGKLATGEWLKIRPLSDALELFYEVEVATPLVPVKRGATEGRGQVKVTAPNEGPFLVNDAVSSPVFGSDRV